VISYFKKLELKLKVAFICGQVHHWSQHNHDHGRDPDHDFARDPVLHHCHYHYRSHFQYFQPPLLAAVAGPWYSSWFPCTVCIVPLQVEYRHNSTPAADDHGKIPSHTHEAFGATAAFRIWDHWGLLEHYY
jgi:hypothetical protein